MMIDRKIRLVYIISLVIVFLLISSFLFYSCGGTQHATKIHHASEIYKAYSGPEKTPGEITTILMVGKTYSADYIDWVIVENTRIDHEKYGEITILPGSYKIKWGRTFFMSPMIKASGSEKRSWRTTISFEAGHTYTIHANRTVGPGYILYSWITDDSLNKILWGKEYVPGPYDNILG